jgi:hypothetical protein
MELNHLLLQRHPSVGDTFDYCLVEQIMLYSGPMLTGEILRHVRWRVSKGYKGRQAHH